MPRSVEEHVAEMLAEIQQQRPDPLDDTGNGHTPASQEGAAEAAANEAEGQEPVHVFFVKDTELQAALLDAQSVEAEARTPAPTQSVTLPPTSRKNAHRTSLVLSVGMFTICVLISILLLMLFIVPTLFIPTATVTITPKTATVSTSATIHLHGRVLPALTLSQSQSVPATGKRHQTATEAQGRITFFNGLYISQAVASGTILTGAHGVQVITDQPAVIPAANPPGLGQTTIRAHATRAGAQGNIPAGDINQPCCLTAVKAVNTTGFSGGQNARDYLVVTKAGIDQAVAPLTASLEKSERAALEAQLNPGEALLTPPCKPIVSSDHKPGEEATDVHVSVSKTCSSVAYDAPHQVYANATQLIHDEAMKRLGTGYQLMGDVAIHLLHVTIVDTMRGIATIAVKCEAIYVYQLSPGEKQHLLHLVAGKAKQQALQTLLSLPGIQGVRISGNAATLPTDPGRITIVVVERI